MKNVPWFREDAEICRRHGIAGVVLPKVERIEDIHRVLERVGTAIPVLPMIETAQGFWSAHTLARAASVQRLLFGALDFQFDLGIGGDGEELLYFRSQLVLVSRIAGIQAPVDGVSPAIDDPERLRAETLHARRLGFGGKLCIHPKQIGYVNECFSPSPEEVAWAKRVVEAAAAVKGAAVAVDGKMVDRPVILKAQEILNESERRISTKAATRQ
jgi:citrate lyase subunit beta/citryl-CoA lyase